MLKTSQTIRRNGFRYVCFLISLKQSELINISEKVNNPAGQDRLAAGPIVLTSQLLQTTNSFIARLLSWSPYALRLFATKAFLRTFEIAAAGTTYLVITQFWPKIRTFIFHDDKQMSCRNGYFGHIWSHDVFNPH